MVLAITSNMASAVRLWAVAISPKAEPFSAGAATPSNCEPWQAAQA